MTDNTLDAASDNPAQGKRWVSGRRLQLLLTASGVSFMIMLDSNIVAVSLPSIARNLNAAFSDIEWVVSAYILAFAAFLMPAGALADRFGRRRVMLSGLVLFTVASVICGIAPSAIVLNFSRTLQGVGAALQLSAALAILGHEFRGKDRGRAFGFWGTVIGVAVTVGPLVGGLITSTLGWRWAFLINLPIGIALIGLALKSVDESRDPEAVRLDIAGITLFGGGLSFLVWALIDGNRDGWSSTSTVAKIALAVVLLTSFVLAESLQKRPMVDLKLFRNPTFIGGNIAMIGFASTAQVMMTYLPLYMQNIFGFSPAYAGLGMLPFALPLFVCPRIAVFLSQRISGRALLTLGLSFVACGNLLMAFVIAHGLPYALVAVGMLITGSGAGLLNGETAKVSMSAVPPERGGMASGIGGTVRFVGLVVGITGLGAVLTAGTRLSLFNSFVSNGLSTDGLGPFAARMIAGDLGEAVTSFPNGQREVVSALARSGFANGFTLLVLVAGIVGAVATALTYWLVGPPKARS